MKWLVAKIGDISDIIDGDRGKSYPKQNEFSDNGYCLFLNTGNVTRQGFDFSNNMFITEEKDNTMRKGKLTRGDIVFTSRGTIGNTAYYSDNVQFDNIRINSGMVILRAKDDKIDKQYLYQLLKSNYQRERMQSYITGSAQPQLPIKNFSQIELPLPPLKTQQQIANILSAYDDLIENNYKQIRLLEEAAMRLYKEWFVNLRFPRHETTKIVDGVPKGWRKAIFRDLCSLVKDGCSSKDISKGTYYIGLEHIPRRSICLNEWGDSSEVSSNKYRYQVYDVLFGKIRPYFHKVGFAINEGVCSTDAMVFRANENMFELLLTTAFSDKFVKHSYATCREGSKMPRADWNEMSIYPVLLPTDDVLIAFNNTIRRYIDLISIKSKQSRRLTEARDMLLPKLMSGEVEV